MRWTEGGLLLPFPPRRAWSTSFWVTFTILMSLFCGMGLKMLVARGWMPGTIALTIWVVSSCVAGAGGIMTPRLAVGAYGAWNRLAHLYMWAARFLVKSVCFWIILTPLGWTGAGLSLSRQAVSKTMWVPRESIVPTAYGAQHDKGVSPRGPQGWMRSYLSWAACPEHAWAAFLLPFLAVLGDLEVDDTASVPSQTYTLF